MNGWGKWRNRVVVYIPIFCEMTTAVEMRLDARMVTFHTIPTTTTMNYSVPNIVSLADAIL
jgi:hypothetical protein